MVALHKGGDMATDQSFIVDYGPSIGKIIVALRSKSRKRVQRACEKEFIKYYKLPSARELGFNTIWHGGDNRAGLVGWTLQALYFAYKNIPDQNLQRFNNMTDALLKLLKDKSEEVKAAALIALGNIGPTACQKAMKAGVLSPCLGSKDSYTKKCANFAANQLSGKPKLPKSMVKQVRQQHDLDLPAYIEADAYMVGAPENFAKPKDFNKYDDVEIEPGEGGVETRIIRPEDA